MIMTLMAPTLQLAVDLVDKISPTETIRPPTAVSVDNKNLLTEAEAIPTVTLRETPDVVQEIQVPTSMARILLTPTGLRSRRPALEATTKLAVATVDSRAAARVVAKVMMTRLPLAQEDMEHPEEEVEILTIMDRTTAPAAITVDSREAVEVMTTRSPQYEAKLDILMSI